MSKCPHPMMMSNDLAVLISIARVSKGPHHWRRIFRKGIGIFDSFVEAARNQMRDK